ncbi:hypothetical protein QVD17_39626 [Tagetes erecta]|uniref:Uncharacterized protein n=1 Tax=Tagetes erecta TaxID=13708 RepID=A0AAD8JSN9_TARER|nr:hypothetical protein QVD17_39626 [Tagetes erecta]
MGRKHVKHWRSRIATAHSISYRSRCLNHTHLSTFCVCYCYICFSTIAIITLNISIPRSITFNPVLFSSLLLLFIIHKQHSFN